MNPVESLLLTFVVVALCVFGVGCAAHVAGYAEAESPVVVDNRPTLVAVEPGLWVVRRYPTPIYYVDGSYWTMTGGLWYRSTTWDGAWVSADVSVVPRMIVRRDHGRYVYYEGRRGAPVRSLPLGHREHHHESRGRHRGHATDKFAHPGG